MDSSHAVIHEPEGFDEPHDAQGARGDDLLALNVVRPAALLGTGLHDPAALLHGLDLLGTFLEGVGHRFLDVDVLPRGERIEEHLFVPVVGGRDDHGLRRLSDPGACGSRGTWPSSDRPWRRPGCDGARRRRPRPRGPRRPRAWSSIAESRPERDPSVWGSGDPSTATARPPVPITPIRTRSLAPTTLAKERALNADRATCPAPAPAEPSRKRRRVVSSLAFTLVVPHHGRQSRRENAPINLPARTVGQASLSTASSGRR